MANNLLLHATIMMVVGSSIHHPPPPSSNKFLGIYILIWYLPDTILKYKFNNLPVPTAKQKPSYRFVRSLILNLDSRVLDGS